MNLLDLPVSSMYMWAPCSMELSLIMPIHIMDTCMSVFIGFCFLTVFQSLLAWLSWNLLSLVLNIYKSFYLCFLNVGIKGIYVPPLPSFIFVLTYGTNRCNYANLKLYLWSLTYSKTSYLSRCFFHLLLSLLIIWH